MDTAHARGKCGRCKQAFQPGDLNITIGGIGTIHLGTCPANRLTEDEAKVLHEIEDAGFRSFIYDAELAGVLT